MKNKLAIFIILYDLSITSNYKLWDIYEIIKSSTNQNHSIKFFTDATEKERINALLFVFTSFSEQPKQMIKQLPFYGLPVILTYLNDTGLIKLSNKSKKIIGKNPYSLSDKSRELLEKEFLDQINNLA